MATPTNSAQSSGAYELKLCQAMESIGTFLDRARLSDTDENDFAHYLRNFRVLTCEGPSSDPVPLKPSDSQFLMLGIVAHLALRLLELECGQQALKQVGIDAIDAWDARQDFLRNPNLAERTKKYMGWNVKSFLEHMREEFVPLVITDMFLTPMMALMFRDIDVHQRAVYYESETGEPTHPGGVILIDQGLTMDKLQRCYDDMTRKNADKTGRNRPTNVAKTLKAYLVYYAMVMAHELAHVFLDRLSCWRDPDRNTSEQRDGYCECPRDTDGLNFGDYAWGGTASILDTEGVDDADNDALFEQLVIQAFERAGKRLVVKYRHVPVEVLDKFLSAPEKFNLDELHAIKAEGLAYNERRPEEDVMNTKEAEKPTEAQDAREARIKAMEDGTIIEMRSKVNLDKYKQFPAAILRTQKLEEFARTGLTDTLDESVETNRDE